MLSPCDTWLHYRQMCMFCLCMGALGSSEPAAFAFCVGTDTVRPFSQLQQRANKSPWHVCRSPRCSLQAQYLRGVSWRQLILRRIAGCGTTRKRTSHQSGRGRSAFWGRGHSRLRSREREECRKRSDADTSSLQVRTDLWNCDRPSCRCISGVVAFSRCPHLFPPLFVHFSFRDLVSPFETRGLLLYNPFVEEFLEQIQGQPLESPHTSSSTY